MFSARDEYFMQEAYALAQQAQMLGEVPVGAVLVKNDVIIGKGHNQPITRHDPCAHAEIVALREGAQKIQNYRLVDTTLYVTLEPCLMCVGAIIHARIGRLVFAARDGKTGAVVSQLQTLDASFLNHKVIYQEGLCADQCAQIMSAFFQLRRLQAKKTG